MCNNNRRTALILPSGGTNTATSCKCGGNCRCASTKQLLKPEVSPLNVVELIDNAQPGCVLREIRPLQFAEIGSK